MRIEERTIRQLIIARKDLQMSPGKLAAQVSHASMAFLTVQIRQNAKKVWKYKTYTSFQEEPFTGKRITGHRPYKHADLCRFSKEAYEKGQDYFTVRQIDPNDPGAGLELCENEYDSYRAVIDIPRDVYEEWIQGIFTKTICEAKNRNQLMKAVTLAEEQGLEEGLDFFLIKDNCLTELEPEEVDEQGVGRTLTCIGFRPLPDNVAHTISRKFHLYV